MKVLVVRLSSFGDQIHVCPAVADLKRQRPDIEIHWLTQCEFAAVPQAHRSVSKVFTVPLTALRKHPFRLAIWREFFQTIHGLRRERYQVAIDVQGVIKSALMSLLSGAKLRIGYGHDGLAERFAYWFYQRHFKYEPGMTSVTKLRHFFRWAFDLDAVSAQVDFGLTRRAVDSIRQPEGVLFVPFASHESKMLPMSAWAALAQALRVRYPGLRIMISWGSKQERQLAHDLALQTQGLVQPNQRRLEFSELIKSLFDYRLVVGADTGITQLANALGIPTVMIFKKSAPQLFYTAGSPYSMQLGSANVGPTQDELEEKVLGLLKRIPEVYS